MSTLVFDTLEHAKKLKAVGFTEAQAEAQTGLIVDLIETQVVTKDHFDRSIGDLHKEMGDIRKEMDARFIDLRKEMDARFKELELRMTIRLGTMMVISIGIVAPLGRLL